jgi:transposase
MRYELSDYEWSVIKPMLPNKPRGIPRVDGRRILNGIFWVLRSGAPWRDLPSSYGPHTTCYNSLRSLAARWRLGPDHGCAGCRSRCRGANDRDVYRPSAPTWVLHRGQ